LAGFFGIVGKSVDAAIDDNGSRLHPARTNCTI
jgi:hypothetical protein